MPPIPRVPGRPIFLRKPLNLLPGLRLGGNSGQPGRPFPHSLSSFDSGTDSASAIRAITSSLHFPIRCPPPDELKIVVLPS